MKFKFTRKKLTFGLMSISKAKNVKRYYIQFSLKDPWFKPKVDRKYLNQLTLYGWLFFYFGKHNRNGDFNITTEVEKMV